MPSLPGGLLGGFAYETLWRALDQIDQHAIRIAGGHFQASGAGPANDQALRFAYDFRAQRHHPVTHRAYVVG